MVVVGRYGRSGVSSVCKWSFHLLFSMPTMSCFIQEQTGQTSALGSRSPKLPGALRRVQASCGDGHPPNRAWSWNESVGPSRPVKYTRDLLRLLGKIPGKANAARKGSRFCPLRLILLSTLSCLHRAPGTVWPFAVTGGKKARETGNVKR